MKKEEAPLTVAVLHYIFQPVIFKGCVEKSSLKSSTPTQSSRGLGVLYTNEEGRGALDRDWAAQPVWPVHIPTWVAPSRVQISKYKYTNYTNTKVLSNTSSKIRTHCSTQNWSQILLCSVFSGAPKTWWWKEMTIMGGMAVTHIDDHSHHNDDHDRDDKSW